MKNSVALIPAAGQGNRLGLGPKAILKLGDQTLIQHVVTVLENCVSRIIVGVPENLVTMVQSQLGARAQVVAGRTTRQATVQRLLECSSEALIVIHDANRPFVTMDLIKRVMAAGQNHGAAAAFLPALNPVARVENGKIVQSFHNNQMMLSQTPQAYRREVMAEAYAYAAEHAIETQATWQLVVLTGSPVTVVTGEDRNIKITTLYDWEVAQCMFKPELHSD